ncbi:MAG TPA: hypothetical protein VGJ00_07955 [Rhabdochlamydiaceae bacterium]
MSYKYDSIDPVSSPGSIPRMSEKIAETMELPYTPPTQPFSSDVLALSKALAAVPALSAERPKLPSPSTLSELRFLSIISALKDDGNRFTDVFSRRIDTHNKEIERINQEQIEKIKTHAEKAQSSQWWDTLKKMATALLTSLSLALGIGVLASGGSAFIGAVLIGSAVLTIGNFVATEMHVWDEVARYLAGNDEERRKKIGWILPSIVGFIAAALGLFGGLNSVAFTSTFLMGKALSLVQGVLSIVQATSTIGQGISRGELIRIQSDMLGVRMNLDEQRFHFDILSQWIQGFLGESKDMNSEVGKIASMIVESNYNIVQQHA